MLIAENEAGQRIEASLDLTGEAVLHCPLCRHPVIFKRGRVKVPHFAHEPGAECAAAGESIRHMLAKQVLGEEFRDLGYAVTFEEPYRDGGRRIDVSVIVPTVDGNTGRVAVEVQDSPISVEEIKRRMAADRRNGFLGTAWVFTGRRFDLLLPARDGAERRIPEEMRYLDNRFSQGVFLLDAANRQVWQVFFTSVVRSGTSVEWYEPGGVLEGRDYPGRRLRAVKEIYAHQVGFRLTCRTTRYHRPGRPDFGISLALESS